MPRILITGASGFIGGYLVTDALARGLEVTATIRSGSDRTRLIDERIRLIELPMHDTAAMERILLQEGRFDWVIHNAGITKALKRETYYDINTGNTQRLVEALSHMDLLPNRFLFVSSLAAYGTSIADRITLDQMPKPLTAYGDSKLQAEKYLEGVGTTFPWITVQPTAVYGPWERDILTVIKLANKGLELTIGGRQQRLSFIHAADVSGSIFNLLEYSGAVGRKFILSDGHDYRAPDVSASIRQALGRSRTLKLNIPTAVMRPIAALSEVAGKWQGKAVPLDREKLAQLTAPNWHCDAQPLLEEVGFKPKYDLYSGMQDAINWYRGKGWI
jgi:nucleoside-diphosphate-sugar epimerase